MRYVKHTEIDAECASDTKCRRQTEGEEVTALDEQVLQGEATRSTAHGWAAPTMIAGSWLATRKIDR